MPTTEKDFDALTTALKNNNVKDLKKILQGFDVTATEDDDFGRNCLMNCCIDSKSPEVVKVVLEKIEETGGPDLLKSQLAATDNGGENCLMLCGFSKSPEVVKVVLEKIEETGGPDLLKSLAAATDYYGRNCLFYCIQSSSPEVVKVILKKIEQTGGPDLLKNQLTATDNEGCNCLLFVCSDSSSPEVVKLILKKIEQTGGPDLLKSLVAATDMYGRNCLMLCGYFSSSPQVEKLFAAVLFHFDLFKIQYLKLDDDDKNDLKNNTGIDSSWTPDAASLAEVKAILQGADSAALAKKKADEEAVAKKKAEEEAAAAKKKPDNRPSDGSVSTDSPPPSLCFRRGVPEKNFEDSVNSLLSIKEAPPDRPDLDDWIPDKHDADALLLYLERALPELKSRPAIRKLIAECSLTDDDIKILHSYKIQNPYPVFLWLNGWLGGDRRDDFVKQNVAPFFTLLYRAMEKLPRVTVNGNRGIRVNNIPALKNTYDNHKLVCAADKTLAFWGFSSFSTEDDVVNREEFVGKPDEEGIVYSCGKLEGVNMEPFKPKGLKDEAEVLPLCPCVFRVVNCFKAGKKLIIGVEQLDHSRFAYVLPNSNIASNKQHLTSSSVSNKIISSNNNNDDDINNNNHNTTNNSHIHVTSTAVSNKKVVANNKKVFRPDGPPPPLTGQKHKDNVWTPCDDCDFYWNEYKELYYDPISKKFHSPDTGRWMRNEPVVIVKKK